MAHVTRPTAHFSPHGGCTEAIVAAIGEAKVSVRFLAYSFTSEAIWTALIEAYSRNVDVRGIVDARMCNERGGLAHRLSSRGVEITADAVHRIQHNKVILADDVVITGSFNLTDSAENFNAENIVILHDPALAAIYLAEWNHHRGHAIALPPPTVGAELPWVEVAGSLADGWSIHVNGAAVGPTVADHRDIIPVVRWLRAALDDLAGVLGARDAEGSDAP